MFKTRVWLFSVSCTALLSFASLLDVGAEDDAGDPALVGGKPLAWWISQLGSSSFANRQSATQQLSELSGDWIDRLVEASREGDFEVTSRVVKILQAAAEKQDIDATDGAVGHLFRLAKEATGARGRVAKQAVDALARSRDRMGRQRLAEAGVFIGQGQYLPTSNQLESLLRIDESFSGDTTTLNWLRWIRGIERVMLKGPACNDEFVQSAAEMEGLRFLQLIKGRLSADGIAALAEADALERLDMNYVKLTSGETVEAEVYQRFAGLSVSDTLLLRGCRIDEAGRKFIESAFPATITEISNGGFLGVQGGSTPIQCIIEATLNGGAAEQAGLLSGDVISKVDDEEIENFQVLRKVIGSRHAGEKIAVHVRRLGENGLEELVLNVTLREIDLP